MNGEWQLLTELGADTANTMVVALSQITKPDPTINEIYHLSYMILRELFSSRSSKNIH